MFRKLIFTALFTFFLTSISFSQKNTALATRSNSITILLEQIQKDGAVTTAATGLNGELSLQYFRFIFLLFIANSNELIELIQNSQGCVRVFAYACLRYNKYPFIDSLSAFLTKDTTKIKTVRGCEIDFLPVSSIIKNIDDWICDDGIKYFLALLKMNLII